MLDKVGTFGFLRICLPLLPAGQQQAGLAHHPAGRDRHPVRRDRGGRPDDLKRFVTFTSIAHFGFIALGVFAFTTQSIAGAALYMVNHGIATGLLFLIVGMLTARGGSKLVGDYGGVWKVAPILGGFFLVAALATIAMPGTNSFISEFLVLIGTFSPAPGLGRAGHHRHRAGRGLHAVDLPADDDRTGARRGRGRRSRTGGPARRRHRGRCGGRDRRAR